jgi:hypothetical protein
LQDAGVGVVLRACLVGVLEHAYQRGSSLITFLCDFSSPPPPKPIPAPLVLHRRRPEQSQVRQDNCSDRACHAPQPRHEVRRCEIARISRRVAPRSPPGAARCG